MTRFAFRIVLSVVLFSGLFGALDGDAQPLRDRVLEDVEINGRCIVVGFSFPIQYVRHFPPESGDTIRIRIRPNVIGRNTDRALTRREAVRPPFRSLLHLSEVIYEGDVLDGPYLVVNFDRKVRFHVTLGRDFRSIVIAVGETPDDKVCFTQ